MMSTNVWCADELEKRVQQLVDERQQLLQKLFDAIEQISDLHAELGPAVLQSLSSKGRAVPGPQQPESTSKLPLLESRPGVLVCVALLPLI